MKNMRISKNYQTINNIKKKVLSSLNIIHIKHLKHLIKKRNKF